MVGRATPGRKLACVGLLLLLTLLPASPAATLPGPAQVESRPANEPAATASNPDAARPDPPQEPELEWLQGGTPAGGERLFTGATRFANGGPPCASCHDIAGLPFPHGGRLGPDLTPTWEKYGPAGLEPVLGTLYFPTMVPLFSARPMTAGEVADLAAFFRAAGSRPPPKRTTGKLAALAAAGMVILFFFARLAWPRRFGSARLIESVGRPEEARR